jgi:two-component system competent response regulator ComA
MNIWDLLHEQGYRVCLAHDEPSVADRLADGDFKVVLLDMRLPDTDGATVFRLVQQTNPQARVLVITGYRTEVGPAIQQLLSAGANGVFEKPFDVPKLLAAVRQLSGE